MISALVGPSWNVKGNTMAIVVSGPMPGSTPMMVPSRHPMKQSRMFCTDSATPKPSAMFPRKPATLLPTPRKSISEYRRPQRDRHLQGNDEDTDIGRDQNRDKERKGERSEQCTGGARQYDGDRERSHQTERPQQQREGKRGSGDQQQRPPRPAFRSFALAHQTRGSECAAESDQHRANEPREIAGPHIARRAAVEVAGEPEAEQAERDEHHAREQVLVQSRRRNARHGSPGVILPEV